jgi:small subunit ribosomal protein S18
MAETSSNSEAREERKPHRSADGPRSKDGAKPEWSGGRFRRPRRKSCRFCADRVAAIDYKDFNRIRSFVSDRGKIIPSRMTGTCASHQRELTKAIKRARNIALLPFAGN